MVEEIWPPVNSGTDSATEPETPRSKSSKGSLVGELPEPSAWPRRLMVGRVAALA
jgi:hypothetical protein